MEIYNTTTGETVNLNYYDRSQDVAQQVDSANELAGTDPNIVYNQEHDRYEANQETIDYWEAFFNKTMEGDDLEREVRELLNESGEDDISERINTDVDSHYFDFEEWPTQRIKLLNKLKSEIKEDKCE